MRIRVAAKSLFALLFVIGLFASVGCLRDPNARKERYLESGNRYFSQGKYEEAAIQFQNAIQIDRNFVPAHAQLAKCYIQRQLWQNAFSELSATAELDPKNWQAQLDLANFLFAAQQFQAARDRAALIVKENPDNMGAQLVLATSDGELGNLPEAIEEAQQSVVLAPDKPAPYLTLALLQERARQFPEAAQNLQKAVALDPKFLPARLGLGSFYQKQKKWSDSEAEYRAAIEVEPLNLIPRTSLVQLYIAWGKKDLAERALQETKAALPDNPAAYSLLGDFYLNSGESQKAFAEFTSLYQQHPNDLNVKKRYIQLLFQNQQFDQALKLSEEILKQAPKDPEALSFKGQVLSVQEKSAEAVPVLEAAILANPADPLAHFQLGVSYHRLKNLAGAQKEWTETLKYKPSLVEANENLAKLGMEKGDWRLVESTVSEWIKYAPSASQAYLVRGFDDLNKGDTSAADMDFRRVIELDPGTIDAYTKLGDVRMAQRRFAEAEKLYEHALTVNLQAPGAIQGLATLFLLQNQPEKALSRVQAHIAKVPATSELQFLLGETLVANHRTLDALQAVQKAVELDKTNVSASLLAAQLLAASERLDDAVSTLDHTLQDNPKDVRPYVELGAFEERKGNWQRAQQLYGEALKIQPNQPIAANNLSYLIVEHGGDLGYAIALARTAWGGMPDSANAADTLGWAYYKSGVYDSAVRMLQEAAKKIPQNPTYQYHLGLAYQKTNRVELARASFQRALRLDPKSLRADEIRQALAELESNPQ